MDLTFCSPEGRFNLRVCAVFLHEGRILAMKDEVSPYYYLPGGRTALHETLEAAVLREVEEELHLSVRILRPLWLNQGFFTEDVTGERFHELCLYFLMDTPPELLARGESFPSREGGRTHRFTWLPLERLREEYFYPLFIKEEVFRLPDHLTLVTNIEE